MDSFPPGTIRPARPGEAGALSALCLRSKAHWGYDAAFMAACRDELAVTPERIAQGPTYVLDAGGPAGLYALDRPEKGCVELDLLYVEPACIGRGYGRALMRHAMARARDLGAGTMIVQADPNAAGFYGAMGGRRIGARPSASIPGRDLPLFEFALADAPA